MEMEDGDRYELQQGKLWLDIRDTNHSEGDRSLEKIDKRDSEISMTEDI